MAQELKVNKRPKDDVSGDEADADDSLIGQICAGLSRYYKRNGVDYHTAPGGLGKFTHFCDENGLDDEGMDDELQGEAGDSLIVDFDEDTFPYPEDCEEGDKQAIMTVLQRCASNPRAYKGSDGKFQPLKVDVKDWDITDDDILAIKTLYKKQLATVFDVGMDKDQSILRLLAVGRKLNAPYLMFLSDVYMREKLKAVAAKSKLSPLEFVKQNKHCQRLKNMSRKPNPADEAQAAITSFYARINPQIMLSPSSRIVADLAKTCKLIGSAAEFVHNKVTKDALACPFQFDVCFAFKEAKEAENTLPVIGDDDDDDDDDEEDDEKGKKKDWFGDIDGKMESEQLVRAKSILDVDHRGFIDPFKEFVEKNDMGKGKKNEHYPRKRRFCAIVDRRKGEEEDDELIFFEPPANCNSFPEGQYVQLWYFDAAKTCILPQKGYDAGKGGREDNITVGTACDGQALTLSFHVESADEIRCYLFVNGGMMRFMPEDLIDFLPGFFAVDFADNAKWATSDEAKQLVKRMNNQLVDARFAAFYEASLK